VVTLNLEDIRSKKCTFCDHSLHQQRIVAQTERFYAIPTVGQISDGGHMLIIPKRHYNCLASLGPGPFNEFEELTARIKGAIENVYGKTVSFEHGILGQSVPHAHLQILPSGDLSSRIEQDFKLKVQLKQTRDIKDIFTKKGVYLYYRDPSNNEYAYILDHFPQYLRHVAAQVAGKPDRGDWRAWREDPAHASFDDELMMQTVSKLKQALK